MWYWSAPATAAHDAVSVPAARVTVMVPGRAGGDSAALVAELRQPLHPCAFPARTATMYAFVTSMPGIVMLAALWLSEGPAAAAQL